MGRGQHMSSFAMADPAVKDFWVLNRRKLVILFAVILPLVITSSYMYFATPGAPTEAMAFFKGRPLASFLPHTVLTGADMNANRSNTANLYTTDSESTQPAEESIVTEMEPNFEVTENTTASLSPPPVEESVDAEMESKFESTGNTTEIPIPKPVEDSVETEVAPSFEGTDNTTESLSPNPVVESVGTEAESTFQSTEERLSPQPVEESVETKVEWTFPTTENTTEGLSPEPAEETLEPSSLAQDEDAETLDTISETVTPANEPIPSQKLLNMTVADSLENSTSPHGNASVDTSNENILEKNSTSVEHSNVTSIIAMGSQEDFNVTSTGSCDLLRGSWVPDKRQPAYTNATCDLILEAQNCMQNGRPDSGYLYWRWQPEQCDLHSIDPRAFLSTMRGRSMAFIGDSIARNQFQSLLCLLSQVERPENTYKAPDDRDNVYVFRTYNFTIAVYWSPYVVHVEYKPMTLPDNTTLAAVDVHLDKLDEALVGRLPGVDILQISTGQWWFKFAYYFQNDQKIGCHTWPGMPECPDIGFVDPYAIALKNIFRGVLATPGFTGTTVLRSFAPDHFEGGSWSSGGHCPRTVPGGVPFSYMTKLMYDVQLQVFQNFTDSLSAVEKQRLRLLDITSLAQERSDGHPDAYRTPHPFSGNSKEHRIQKDCLHWCLPGPIDTWNDLLVQILRNAVYA